MSLRLPPVSVQASGMPPPSTRRCCLLPRRPRSTGLGPVCEPPFSLAHGWSRRSRATTRSLRPRATQPATARAAAARHPPAATRATDATPSSRNQNRAPAADAPSRSPCARRTRPPATPADHQTACGPDSESAARASAAAAQSAPTTHPTHPTASPASPSPPKLDDGCRRTSLPRGGSLQRVRASKPHPKLSRYYVSDSYLRFWLPFIEANI